MAETDTVRESITVVPVTGAIYHNGQEKPTERWSFELGLNVSEDKILSTVLKRLEKGYGIKDKCAALNIMHGSILRVTIPPPGNPGDKSSPSGPGVGNCLKRSCPGGRGAGQIKKKNFLLFL